MPLTYDSVDGARQILDKTLETGGLTLTFSSPKKMTAFRHRLYSARTLEKKKSEERYEPGDPGYNASPWDNIRLEADKKMGPDGMKDVLILTVCDDSTEALGIESIVDAEGNVVDLE